LPFKALKVGIYEPGSQRSACLLTNFTCRQFMAAPVEIKMRDAKVRILSRLLRV